MSKRSRTRLLAKGPLLPGHAGEPMHSIVQHGASAHGSAPVAFNIDLSSAPVPDRRYMADVVGVEYAQDRFKLLFAQQKLGGRELRSLLIVSMTPDRVVQLLKSVEDMRSPTIDEIGKLTGQSEGKVEAIETEPAQTVYLVSNLVALGFSGYEACLDFYHFSPIAAAKMMGKGDIVANRSTVDPVVRVHIGCMSCKAMIDRLRQIVDQQKSEGRSWNLT